MSDYRLELINNQTKLAALAAQLMTVPVIALDIETVEWWDRYRERVALIQIAFRAPQQEIKVAVIDALAKEINVDALRPSLESKETIKVIHNAAFDAGKLFKHYKFKLAPIFDTMTAARRCGEKKYSLAAQASAHLGLHLDKGAQRSDWSRRPLDIKQLDYAARDAYAALLLYENQTSRNLAGSYRSKYDPSSAVQGTLDLSAAQVFRDAQSTEKSKHADSPQPIAETASERREMALAAKALLSIVSRLPDRYSPAKLAASVGLGRVGLAGWIVDGALGRDADFDEATAQLIIADLIEQGLVKVSEYQTLKPTDQGQASAALDLL